MIRRALCLGLNEVLPAAYGGWQGWLKNPVNDARDCSAFFARAGYTANAIFDLEATVDRLRSEMFHASESLDAGDTFVLFYSGHGGQSPAWTWNGYRETLCLADGELADTALRELFAALKPGVRAVFISDSCHSGGLARTIPPSRGKPAFVRSAVSLAAAEREIPIAASMMLVAACQADELASDGEGNNGAFTAALLQVADDFEAQSKPLTWETHIEAVQRYMARDFPTQHPIAERYGAAADWNVEINDEPETHDTPDPS